MTLAQPTTWERHLPTIAQLALTGYIEAALWAETVITPSASEDEDRSWSDLGYDRDSLAPATLKRMVADVTAFMARFEGDVSRIEGDRYDPRVWGQAGHDLWLTRNRHGVGFWDGDWPEPFAAQATAYAHTLGETDLYADSDGVIWQSGAECDGAA